MANSGFLPRRNDLLASAGDWTLGVLRDRYLQGHPAYSWPPVKASSVPIRRSSASRSLRIRKWERSARN